MSRALPEAACELLANHAASCERCHVLVDLVFDHADHSALRTDEAVAASRADFDALDRGTLVGRYRIAEHLGGGGMGVVYAAEDTELRRRVAVKLLRSALRPAAPEGERMLREARTLARLSHPNVVTVFDVGTHEGRPFIAMELVDGGSLNQWLRTAERTLDDRLDRMLEAARGLAAAHAAGVVHRDVKPENILVGGGRSRVTDFGLANSDPSGAVHPGLFSEPGSLTRTGTVMGTPAYMAPEQLVGRTVDPRSDQWSFCATLYEVVAGTRPFADDPAARSIAIGEGRLADPVPPRAVPPWLRKIIARGVRPLPSERWPSMDAIVDALARGRRRRRTAWSVVIAVTAAVTVGAATAARRPTPAAQAMPPRASDQERWHDSRPGCDCPYSACAGGCTSICRASAFPDETPVPGINGATSQEALLGASRDGRTLLYLTGERCAIDRLMLARRRGETFETFELTGQLDLDHVSVFEGCCTLSPDGASVIIATKDRKAFVRSRLDGAHLGPLERDEFARLRPRDGDETVRFPVLSDDERQLYFRLDEPPGMAEAPDGPYVATRRDARGAFPPGERLAGRARSFEYVTGVSSDNLSLFMASEFETRVLVRSRTDLGFGDPAFTLAPARLRGWRAIPLATCSRIVTTTTPGGCAGEDIVWLDAVAP